MLKLSLGLLIGVAAGAGGVFLALNGERGHDHADHAEPEEKPVQLSLWGKRFEIFLEHPALVAGAPAKFLFHVSDLATGAPRREGSLKVSGPIEHVSAAPDRQGIYAPTLTMPTVGDGVLSVQIDDELHEIPVKVHASKEAAAKVPPVEPPEGIQFLKEQQWTLETRVEPAGKRKMTQRVRLPGTVAAHPGWRVEISPPVNGRFLAPADRDLPTLGEKVEAGQVLGRIRPPSSDFGVRNAEAQAETIRTGLALKQAEAAAVRIRKLASEKVRSERELQEAEYAVESARAARDSAEAMLAAFQKSGADVFEIRSPIKGVLTRVAAVPGENVHAEHAYFTVLDASSVHIEARVPETDLSRIATAAGAHYEFHDARGRFIQVQGPPLLLGLEVDPATRTVPLVYRVPNPDGRLKIGMALTIHVETAHSEDAVSLPDSAIVDEEGRFVAFVQTGGETFQKRDLLLGIRETGHAQVLRGVAAGERVVTRGAYAVRLASVSTSIPAHSHEH